jgi:hypothetical protein
MQTSTVARNLVLGALLGLLVSSAAHASGTIHADKVVVIKDEKLPLLLHNGEILKSYKVAIGIHGLPEGFEDLGASHADFNWTRGCIAVSNEEMDEIWELVADGTPIKILP